MNKRGPEKQYASEQERNRDKQQRHRDKITRLRLQLRGVEVAGKLAQCVKCNLCAELTRQAGTAVVCPACQRVRDEGLAEQKLTETRASTNHAGQIVSGGNNATHVDVMLKDRHMAADHGRGVTHGYNDEGKAVTKGRYTGRVGQKHILQLGAEGCVQTEQTKRQGAPRDPRTQLMQMWCDHMRYTRELSELRKRLPNASQTKLIKLLMLTDEGKKVWLRLQGGAPADDHTQRNETLDQLLSKGA
jgi:hypothetical protein